MDNDKQQQVSITNSQVQVLPVASGATMTINAPRQAVSASVSRPSPNAAPSALSAQVFVTHDAVGVPELMLHARRHIVLHAAYYPTYGIDQQGMSLWNAMRDNPQLHLTAIFTDCRHTQWADEFARIMRCFYQSASEFQVDLDYTKRHFNRLLNKFGADRVSIIDTPRLPLFPVIMIDNTLVVGHYAHSEEMAPSGLWFTLHHPKIVLLYESLLAGNSPLCEDSEERALIRYLHELIDATRVDTSAATVKEESVEDAAEVKKLDSPHYKIPSPRCRAEIREDILRYVSRVDSLLSFDWRHNNRFIKVWKAILDLPEVEREIYKVGRQQGTTFNRSLVAGILRYLDKYGTYNGGFCGSVMARCLENDISHPIRIGFGNDLPKAISESINRIIRRGDYER